MFNINNKLEPIFISKTNFVLSFVVGKKNIFMLKTFSIYIVRLL